MNTAHAHHDVQAERRAFCTGLLGVAALAVLTPLPLAAAAEEATLPAAPAHIAQQVANARLAGQGEYTWFTVKLYDAWMWVGDRGYLAAQPDAAPFALELRYARAFKGKRIAGASIEQIEKLGLGSADDRARWLADLEQLIPDVAEGDRITGLFRPRDSALLYLNGKTVGTIADPKLARAFFAIWLAPNTTAGKLRQALLRHAAPV